MTDTEMLSLILEKVTHLDSHVAGLDSRVAGLESDMKSVKQTTTDIKLTLENETNRNIKIIAEGHSDLSRKLDDVLKIENEKEMLQLRVNILESDMRRVKEQSL